MRIREAIPITLPLESNTGPPLFPAEIFGVSILLGGDLVLEFNAQEACHAECLIDQGKRLAGVDRIPVTFLRGGRVMHAVVDVSKTRRNFLSSPD